MKKKNKKRKEDKNGGGGEDHEIEEKKLKDLIFFLFFLVSTTRGEGFQNGFPRYGVGSELQSDPSSGQHKVGETIKKLRSNKTGQSEEKKKRNEVI